MGVFSLLFRQGLDELPISQPVGEGFVDKGSNIVKLIPVYNVFIVSWYILKVELLLCTFIEWCSLNAVLMSILRSPTTTYT